MLGIRIILEPVAELALDSPWSFNPEPKATVLCRVLFAVAFGSG
jgi:hypothetical protein